MGPNGATGNYAREPKSLTTTPAPTVIRKGLVQSQRMRFEVLGPLQMTRDGDVVALTSRRQVALLANLLIAKGKAVTAESLIEAVWGHDLPSDPANTLQHAISQLRKLVEPERGCRLKRRRACRNILFHQIG